MLEAIISYWKMLCSSSSVIETKNCEQLNNSLLFTTTPFQPSTTIMVLFVIVRTIHHIWFYNCCYYQSAYIDLRAAFNSHSRPALWSLLTRIGIPESQSNWSELFMTTLWAVFKVHGWKLSQVCTRIHLLQVWIGCRKGRLQKAWMVCRLSRGSMLLK